jgi:hypothetical protein
MDEDILKATTKQFTEDTEGKERAQRKPERRASRVYSASRRVGENWGENVL